MTVRVVTAAQAAARDAAAIAGGTASRLLMQRAGHAAADLIADRHADSLARGVVVLTGPGNNGGDGWVVARRLSERGVAVRVHEAVPARSGDALAERDGALPGVSLGPASGSAGLVVDALLGTGAHGEPAGPIADAVQAIRALQSSGATVVALDMPTGLDATTGSGAGAVGADLTITFGTVKRGQLLARGRCGTVVVVDIGLGPHADLEDGAPRLVDEPWVRARVPAIGAEFHKGTRRRVVIAGGARGMAGATVLAARGALRSGAGMVRVIVEEPSLGAVQAGVFEATASTWPLSDDALTDATVGYAHAVLIGPGLGRSDGARRLLDRLLDIWRGPTVLDADALNLFTCDVPGLARALAGRPALITPHANELGRLIGVKPDEVAAQRFDIGAEVARTLGATVLLKGVPTVITAPDGAMLVSASGTPVLAAAGSGDVLGGIAVTLLAQTGDPLASGACAAWIHGRLMKYGAGRPTAV